MKQRIKIVFTIPNFDTAGSGRVVFDLVKGIDKSLFEPHICCTHSRGDYFKVVQGLGVPIHVFSFYTPYTPYLSFFFRVLKTARFFKKNQFDIIHSWHWSSDFSEPLAAKLAGIPYIYTKKAMGWGNKSWVWRSKLSAKIIAINTDMMTQFFSKLTHKAVYMPLGIDTNHFQPLTQTRSIPNGIAFKATDFVIVSIANLAPIKGIEVLLEAVKMLNMPEIKVLIIGDYKNEYGKELIETYNHLNVCFIDKQIDIKPYLAIANLFVIPTLDKGEGLPIAPLEAMASGRIVIGSNVSGIKDILEDFQSCLFQPNDIRDLASKILEIMNLPLESKAQLAKDMRRSVESDYTVNKFIENHETLYKELMK